MTVQGSDDFADAPLLPFNSWSVGTPSAGLTADAGDDSQYVANTAWWKVIIPEGHDWNTKVRFDIRQSYITTPGDSPAELYVWQGATRDTLSLVSSGTFFELDPLFTDVVPGAVYYLEAVTNPDNPNLGAVTYVIGAGDVTFSYSAWEDGGLVNADPVLTTGGIIETRLKEVFGPTIEASFDGRDPEMNATRNQTGGEDAALTSLSQPAEGPFRAWVFSDATSAQRNYNEFSTHARREDSGIVFSVQPLAEQVASGYVSLLMATPPPAAVAVELESDTYTVSTVDVDMPLENGGNGLYVTTKIRPIESYGNTDTLPLAEAVDERLWPATDGGESSIISLTFTTSSIGSTGLVAVWPESRPELTPAWASSPPVFNGDNQDYGSGAAHTVRTPFADPRFTISGAVQPPRHRWRFEHFLDDYVPPEVFGIPPLRQVQRGDGLGFSSAPRAIQNNSVQGSLRNFGFN